MAPPQTAEILLLALPSSGDPGFPAVIATFSALLGGAVRLVSGKSWDGVQDAAFRSGFLGSGIGTVIYLIDLVAGL